MDKIEVESFEDFDFRKYIYVIHKFDSKIDDIGELENFHKEHRYELFDNCGLSFRLKDYFDLNQKSRDWYDDYQKVNGVFFNVDIELPKRNSHRDYSLEKRGRSWITVYRDEENSRFGCCHCLASINWAIKTIETFSDEERNDKFVQYANRLKLFKASYEYISNVFLKNGDNVLNINRNTYNKASKYIDDEIRELKSKQDKIKELVDRYSLED